MATVPISAFLHSPRQDKAPKGLVFCVCVCRRRCAFIVCFVCFLYRGLLLVGLTAFLLEIPCPRPPFFHHTPMGNCGLCFAGGRTPATTAVVHALLLSILFIFFCLESPVGRSFAGACCWGCLVGIIQRFSFGDRPPKKSPFFFSKHLSEN